LDLTSNREGPGYGGKKWDQTKQFRRIPLIIRGTIRARSGTAEATDGFGPWTASEGMGAIQYWVKRVLWRSLKRNGAIMSVVSAQHSALKLLSQSVSDPWRISRFH
jgi:hypothetical protein